MKNPKRKRKINWKNVISTLTDIAVAIITIRSHVTNVKGIRLAKSETKEQVNNNA